MNIENADILIKSVGKRFKNKSDNSICTITKLEKELKIKDKKINTFLYRLFFDKKELCQTKKYEYIGTEDSLISKMREFEIID